MCPRTAFSARSALLDAQRVENSKMLAEDLRMCRELVVRTDALVLKLKRCDCPNQLAAARCFIKDRMKALILFGVFRIGTGPKGPFRTS